MPKKSSKVSEQQLLDHMALCYDNPRLFVDTMFDWTDPTIATTENPGPDVWQYEVLDMLGEYSRDCFTKDMSAFRLAIASGHGIGKGTLTAWIILWYMSTRPLGAGLVTANTSRQLTGKTWRELSIWHKRLLNSHWFKHTKEKFMHLSRPGDWFFDALTWNRASTEAFAGLHGQHVLVVFDEASGIDKEIYNVIEGAMSTKGAMWICMGNPTTTSGKFYSFFSGEDKRWITRNIDSRTCKMVNKKEINAWLEYNDEDSDFIRVRVRGEFPRRGSLQLIDVERVIAAMKRDIDMTEVYHNPIIMGVDVARFGDDRTVLYIRQGFKTIKVITKRGLDVTEVADLVANTMVEYHVDGTFIDITGIGAGVFDILVRQGHLNVYSCEGHNSPSDQTQWINKRAENWCRMADWLKHGDIPSDLITLKDDLIVPEYKFKGSAIQIESKEDMKKRGFDSPDEADALSLTFTNIIYKKGSAYLQPVVDNNMGIDW